MTTFDIIRKNVYESQSSSKLNVGSLQNKYISFQNITGRSIDGKGRQRRRSIKDHQKRLRSIVVTFAILQ